MPSDPVTLDDLRRIEHPTQDMAEPYRHRVTLDDLIQVLEGMGAKRRKLYKRGDGQVEDGTYLVMRLEDE